MAALPPRNFRGLFANLADPYQDDVGALQAAFAVNAANTPESCYTNSEQAAYPLFFLANNAATHRPIAAPVVGAGFSTDMPGRADNTGTKWFLVGDLTVEGIMCPMTEIAQAKFHLTQNIHVPTTATFAATWAARGAGVTHLPPQNGLPNTEEIRTRLMMPIPHPYVADLLRVHEDGSLTWD